MAPAIRTELTRSCAPELSADCCTAARFHLGRIDLELPDRGRDARRRPRPQRLGHLRPTRPDRQPRHRRRRLRPLPPLSGRHRADAAARRSGLPVFRRLAARSAAGARDAERAGPGVLRPPDRCDPRRRYRAVALPLSLGHAAGARRSRRLDDARLRCMVRRLCRSGRRAAMATGSSASPRSTSRRSSLCSATASAAASGTPRASTRCTGPSTT